MTLSLPIYTNRAVPVSDAEPAPCPGRAMQQRALWARVLHQAVLDLLGNDEWERDNAERWVGAYPSRDFCEVCTLAGGDPDTIWPMLRGIVDGDAAHRAAVRRTVNRIFYRREA